MKSSPNPQMKTDSSLSLSGRMSLIVGRNRATRILGLSPTPLKRKGLIALCLMFLFVSSLRAEQITNRLRVIRVPGTAKVLKAQRSADGAIHLLLDAADGPQYLKSEDGGLTFSSPIAIVNPAAQKPGLKFSGWDMAVGKDGRVHVAMGNNA